MKRGAVVFLFLAIVLTVLTLAVSSDFDIAVSVIPGWHTTILPPYFLVGGVALLWLYLLAGAYFILGKKRVRIKKRFMMANLMLSLPLLYIAHVQPILFPLDFSLLAGIYLETIVLFFIGQFVFLWGVIKALLPEKS
ncbi:hypothetical protein [Rufibacter roseus]|uniref:DUF4293 family protein n=1 Tax=Rufibacter roseus TaxID=1567108 RepID=A0ABW2DHV3_9BACT|nr:hypothetical protein [Rufibacter roseus]